MYKLFFFLFLLQPYFAFSIQSSFINVKVAGAKGDGVNNDTKIIQHCIDSYQTIFLPKGDYLIEKCILKEGIKIYGENGTRVISLDIKDKTNQNGSFELIASSGRKLRNISISNLTFISNAPYHFNLYPRSIFFKCTGNSEISDVIFTNLVFITPCDNAILLLANQAMVGFKNIILENCKAIGSSNYKKFAPANLIRIINNSDPNTNYGIITAEGIKIRNCYAEYLRTLADIKRGCKDVTIENNKTKNMHDCHYSIDGSFYCIIKGNTSLMNEKFVKDTAWTAVNFIEVQGENIQIKNNYIDCQRSHGIYITDYGYPSENQRGHNSKNILISKNTIRKVLNGIGIKILNGININIEANTILSSSVFDIVVDSGSGLKDFDRKTMLKASRITITNNKISQKGIFYNSENKLYKSNKSKILIQ